MHLLPFRKNMYFYAITVAVALGFAGCYSFTGASVPQHWKTIAVPLFDDESTYGEPGLRERITGDIVQKVQRDNTLRLTDRSTADVVLLGSVASITPDEPITLETGERASAYRITVRLKVSLYDRIMKKQVWEKQFSASGNYAAGSAARREDGLKTAIDLLSDNVVLETVSGW